MFSLSMVVFLVSPMHRHVEPTGFPQETVSSRGRNPAAAVCGDFPGSVSFQRSEPRVQDGGAGSLCHHTEYPDAARADPSKGEVPHLPPEQRAQYLKLDLVRVDEDVIGGWERFQTH